MRINYGQSVHSNEEIKACIKVLKTSTRMGSNVKKLEKKVAKLFSKKYCLMTNSGSSALLLLSEILKFKKNDEFISPVVTFPTSISSFLMKGMIPRFIDVDLQSLQINENLIEKNINKKTKFIIVPNLIGNVPNWKKINKIAKKHNLITIEDSADTIGSKLSNKNTGYFSDYSITSFYGSHVINCAGNGGALCLNEKENYLKAKIIRSWGRTSSLFEKENFKSRFNFKLKGIPYDKKFVFKYLGHNLEPSEIGAAFGIVQFKKLKENLRIRKKNFTLHHKFFLNYNNLFILPTQLSNVSTAWLAFPLIVKSNAPFKRTELQKFLEKSNIQTRPIFTGNILKQPAFSIFSKFNKNKFFGNADLITRGGLLIGLHQGINSKSINYIHKKFDKFLKKFN